MQTNRVLTLSLLIAVGFTAAPKRADAQSARVVSAPYRTSTTGAGNSHSPVFSADGRHVAFVSHANNLVTNDDLGPYLDLFVCDLMTSNTVLVSVSTNGFGGANDNVGLYTLSSNAQVIAFETAANDLAPSDTNRVTDIYVRDLLAGTTRLVSVNAEGNGSGNGPSSNPLLSEDGRYVIFESLASNLVTNDFNGTNDIFIRDLATGVTELASVNAEGTASPDGPSHSPSISADGLRVAFVTQATNLVPGIPSNYGEIYLRDIAGRSNVFASGRPATSTNLTRSSPIISADGRYIAFQTRSGEIHRYDTHRPTNTVVQRFGLDYSIFGDNPRFVHQDSGPFEQPLSMSAEGRFVVYSSKRAAQAEAVVRRIDFETIVLCSVTIDGQGSTQTWYVTNCCPKTELISAGLLTNDSGGTLATALTSTSASMSADGQRIVFLAGTQASEPSGQLVEPFGGYLREMANDFSVLITTNVARTAGPNLGGVVPAISPNGSLIAWDSPDNNIVGDDLNRAWDVFVRNVDTGETQLISARHPGLPAASATALSRLDLNPGAISANGQRLAFISLDNTLTPDDTNFVRDAFVLDRESGSMLNASAFPPSVPPFQSVYLAGGPSLSADGRYLAFAGELFVGTQNANRILYWRDLQTPTNRMVVGGASLPVLNPTGRLLAFHSDGGVFVCLMRSDPSRLDCSLPPFAFAPVLVSVAAGTTTSASGPSINPAFSSDSEWVLFQSLATDLLSVSIPAPSIHQLYKRGVEIVSIFTNGCGPIDVLAYTPTDLISYSTTASLVPSGTSVDLPLPGGGANPRFSGDSHYVAFESSPNLIYRHDLLGGWVTKIITDPDPLLPSLTNRARLTNDIVCSNCANPTLNADGRLVAYETRRATNVANDIFVKDLQTDQEELVSVNLSGSGGGNGSSSTPLISYDARFVVFASKASDLVPGDNNRVTDIFVRDRLNQVTHCLSRNFSGTGTGNRVSSNPIMSADGRTVAFQSFAGDLVPGDYNDTRDVFVVTLGGPDTDGDGMDDDWEMAYFNTLDRNGSGDFDNDGASDLAEFRAGTNPANDASILRVLRLTTAVDLAGTGRRSTVLLWSAIPGRTYRVQFKAHLDAPWTPVAADVTAASTSASLTDTIEAADEAGNLHRFYRVLLVQ